MNRRKFIQHSTALGIPFLLNGLKVNAWGSDAFAHLLQNVPNDRVLVMVQLFGGNDGLNTIIPIDQYGHYFNARKNIAIGENKILRLPGTGSTGLHPALGAFQALFGEGKLNIVQSVGYPQPNMSHFRSTDIWLSASDADKTVYSGFLGRYLEKDHALYPKGYPNPATPHPLAIQFGTATSFLFQGPKLPMAVNVTGSGNAFSAASGFTQPANASYSGKALSFVRQVAQQSQDYGDVLKKTADAVKQQANYPVGNPLAQQLKTVAQLVKGGLQTKIYLVTYDGFDTHAQQAEASDSSTGRHADLLRITSEAIKAFQDDLQFLGVEDRVAGLVFSEFGRRIVSNESLGTDHGAAAPVFVFGKHVKGGITGGNPLIPAKADVDDNLDMQIDFRSVYASLLKNWLQVPGSETDHILSGSFTTLPLF